MTETITSNPGLTDEQWLLGQKFSRAQTKAEAERLLAALVTASRPALEALEAMEAVDAETLNRLLDEHRPNVVVEEIGPAPLHWRTRIKCDGEACDFYVEDNRYWTAAKAHTGHLTEKVAEFIGTERQKAAGISLREAAEAFDVDHEGRKATEHTCLRINCSDCVRRDFVERLLARSAKQATLPAATVDPDADLVALAAEWNCNCGGPSPEGHHEMHCDSYYGDRLRDALRRRARA